MSEQNTFANEVAQNQEALARFNTEALLPNGDVNHDVLEALPLDVLPLARAQTETAETRNEDLLEAIDVHTEAKVMVAVHKVPKHARDRAYDNTWKKLNVLYQEEVERIENDDSDPNTQGNTVKPQPASEDPLADVIRSMNSRGATTADGNKAQGPIRSTNFSHFKGATEKSTHEEIADKDERREKEQQLGKNIGKILAQRRDKDGVQRSLTSGFQPFSKPLLTGTKKRLAKSESGVPIYPLVLNETDKKDDYEPRLVEGAGLKRRTYVKRIKKKVPKNTSTKNAH